VGCARVWYECKVCVCTCGNHYLSKRNTIESELADTRGSTATGAPPLKKKQKNRNVLCAFLCVPSHNKTKNQV
jgi:hypothetical protein